MARDRNFQRKQKDARMPARDSHGEDRMAARQGEPDYDLRRANMLKADMTPGDILKTDYPALLDGGGA